MGRFTPAVAPLSALDALSAGLEGFADGRDEREERELRIAKEAREARAEERLARAAELEEAMARARAAEAGVEWRDEEPTQTKRVRTQPAPAIFEDQRLSFRADGAQAPDVFHGASLADALGGVARRRPDPTIAPSARVEYDGGVDDDYAAGLLPESRPARPALADSPDEPNQAVLEGLDALQQRGRERPPRVVALPGAFVRGMGFTERMLTDRDLFDRARPGAELREMTTREVPDDAYERMTGETGERGGAGFFRKRDHVGKVAEAARALGATPAELALIKANPDFADEVYRSIQTRAEEASERNRITIDGREFPNTPEGEKAAAAWHREYTSAGRAPTVITVEGRDFPDTPEGARQAEAWKRSLALAGRAGGAPERNTPEYEAMLEREARARAAASGGNTEQARMARALAPLMEDAYTRLSAMDTPDLAQKIASSGRWLGNYFNSPEGRQFKQASLQFLQSALSITSGKTVTEQEAERNEAIYIPQPGDDEETVRIKMNAMRTLATAARALGGDKTSGFVGDPDPAFSDDPDEAAEQARQMMRGGGG